MKDINKNIEHFYPALAIIESSNNLCAENRFHYLDLYQMDEPALHDAGYYDEIDNPNFFNNDWKGVWKKGLKSKDDFLNRADIQGQDHSFVIQQLN